MPMSRALQLCPDAIVLSPRHSVYREYSQRVMDILRQVTDQVEQTSIDEAYLDLSDRITGWEEGIPIAQDIQNQVHSQERLSASLGVATNKLVAKVASDYDKPGGLTVVRPGEEASFLAPLPVRVLSGVGPVTATKLAEIGVSTVGDLATVPVSELRARFGKQGQAMARHAQGIDQRPVRTDHQVKSISQERTFPRDLARPEALKHELERLSEGVSHRLQSAGVAAMTISIKLRYSDFSTLTRQTTLQTAIDDKATIYEAALALLQRTWQLGRPVRLLGVGGQQLVSPQERPPRHSAQQLPLF
jgi:DNA polymerase-4